MQQKQSILFLKKSLSYWQQHRTTLVLLDFRQRHQYYKPLIMHFQIFSQPWIPGNHEARKHASSSATSRLCEPVPYNINTSCHLRNPKPIALKKCSPERLKITLAWCGKTVVMSGMRLGNLLLWCWRFGASVWFHFLALNQYFCRKNMFFLWRLQSNHH